MALLCFSATASGQQRGRATYYSKRATGSRTANGERLHHDSMTCAHRTYPFGTKLKVTNPQNGKSVIVRVTDRGPYGRGLIIDLSYAAAREIGMLAQGVAMVEVEKVDKGIPYLPDDDEGLPLMEFEYNGGGYSFMDEWSKKTNNEELVEKKTEKIKKQVARKSASKSRTAKPAEADKKALKSSGTEKAAGNNEQKKTSTQRNRWSDIFEGLKHIF